MQAGEFGLEGPQETAIVEGKSISFSFGECGMEETVEGWMWSGIVLEDGSNLEVMSNCGLK